MLSEFKNFAEDVKRGFAGYNRKTLKQIFGRASASAGKSGG